jgi:hypothetical protein
MDGRLDPAAADADVFFFDDFETGHLHKWDSREAHPAGQLPSLTRNIGLVGYGRYSLELTALPGRAAGAKVVKWFLPGLDQVHARWYCLFPPDFEPGMGLRFCGLLGGPASDPYAAFSQAATRPSGRDFFSTALDPLRQGPGSSPPGRMALYTYYPDMAPDSHGQYWGNAFRSDPPFAPELGRWYCMEMMVKCNTPGQYDGEQVAWIDGEQVVRVTGLRWRDTEEVKVHAFWLQLYLSDSPRVNRVYFDNVALSRRYIGPVPG